MFHPAQINFFTFCNFFFFWNNFNGNSYCFFWIKNIQNFWENAFSFFKCIFIKKQYPKTFGKKFNRWDQKLTRFLLNLIFFLLWQRKARFQNIWKLLFLYSARSDNFWKFELLSIKIWSSLTSLHSNVEMLLQEVGKELFSHLGLVMTLILTKKTHGKRIWGGGVQKSVLVRLSSYAAQKIRIEPLLPF